MRTTSVSGSLAQGPSRSTLPRIAVTGAIFFEFVEDRGFAHVAEVEDAVDAVERGSDFGAEKTVGVADDAEVHGFRMTDRGSCGMRNCAGRVCLRRCECRSEGRAATSYDSCF